jgi:branched-subunit amino acid ABC-type transport system permease component
VRESGVTEMNQNLTNWMLTGAIFLAHSAMFLVAAAVFYSRTEWQRGPAAEGVLILLTTITVATAATGLVIIVVASAAHEARQRAVAAAQSESGETGEEEPASRGEVS